MNPNLVPIISGGALCVIGLAVIWYMETHHPIFVRITQLSDEDGGGFLAEVTSMPGCATDGETEEEALSRVPEAMRSWRAMAEKLGRAGQ